MLQPLRRLKKRREFLAVARCGRKWVTPGLVLQAGRAARPEEADQQAADIGFGLTASRKVGSAVERNRARRRLRAAVQEILPQHAKTGEDYVVIARRGTLHRPYAELLEDLRQAAHRLSTKNENRRSQPRRRQGKAQQP